MVGGRGVVRGGWYEGEVVGEEVPGCEVDGVEGGDVGFDGLFEGWGWRFVEVEGGWGDEEGLLEEDACAGYDAFGGDEAFAHVMTAHQGVTLHYLVGPFGERCSFFPLGHLGRLVD